MTLVTRISRLEAEQNDAQQVQRFEICATDEGDAMRQYEDILLSRGHGLGAYVVSVATPNRQWKWDGAFRTHEERLEALELYEKHKDVAHA